MSKLHKVKIWLVVNVKVTYGKKKISLVVHFKVTEESYIFLGASDEVLTSPNTNQLDENTFTEGEWRLLGLRLNTPSYIKYESLVKDMYNTTISIKNVLFFFEIIKF